MASAACENRQYKDAPHVPHQHHHADIFGMDQTQSEVSDSSRCQACDRGRQTRRKRGAAPEHYNHSYAGHSAEQHNEEKT